MQTAADASALRSRNSLLMNDCDGLLLSIIQVVYGRLGIISPHIYRPLVMIRAWALRRRGMLVNHKRVLRQSTFPIESNTPAQK